MSRTAVESERVEATSWTVFFITSAGAGHTISWPVRLTRALNASGYSGRLPTRSVSQSRDTSAVRTAANWPFVSVTGSENVVISISPPPVS